jgi:alpha-beta hydrolase superfamily lysophospholipase
VTLEGCSGTPVVHTGWFPSGPGADAPLQLGFVHLPDGGLARGAVVLCPPVGMEYTDSYRGLRLAAQQLSAAGLVVVRFDYPGTGDSLGEQTHPAAVRRWLAGTAAAVALARSTGVTDVALVGLRVGALLAAQVAAAVGPLRALALWDPVLRGRALLRHQMAIYRIAVGGVEGDDSVVSLPALVLHRAASAELAALRVDAAALVGAAPNVLVAARPAGLLPTDLGSLVDTLGATQLELPHQTDWLERASSHTRIPAASIGAVTGWLSAAFGSASTPVTSPELATRVQVGTTTGGEPVYEELVRTGPHQLFTIVTRPEVTQRSVVLNASSKEHRVGPARLWTELARELATAGAEAVRFDRRGTGESGEVDGAEQTPMYSADALADALEVAAALRHDPAQCTFAGLCSGSWMAYMAAISHRAGAAVLISPVIWTTRTRERRVTAAVAATQRTIDRVESATGETVGEVEVRSWRRHVKRVLAARLPYPLWLMLGRAGALQVPEVALAALRRAEVRTVVILPPGDYGVFVEQRGAEGLRRLTRRGRPPQLLLPGTGDHSLLHRATRRQAMDVVGAVAAGGTPVTAGAQSGAP